jgi:hypothetical protein
MFLATRYTFFARQLQGFRTYIPAQDRNKPFAEQKLGNITTVTEFYEFTYPDILRKAKTIDVTWFNDRKYPSSFFEIEHSTDIHNSLLKFVELQDFRTKLYIVADSNRKAEFDNKLSFYAFSAIRPFVKFWDYESVLDIHAKVAASNLAIKEVL